MNATEDVRVLLEQLVDASGNVLSNGEGESDFVEAAWALTNAWLEHEPEWLIQRRERAVELARQLDAVEKERDTERERNNRLAEAANELIDAMEHVVNDSPGTPASVKSYLARRVDAFRAGAGSGDTP